MRTYALYLTSISCGFCMMALEIIGGRFLQPDFGSSIDVWAAIISVFILSLSVGYWLGGRIADRSTTNRPLGWIIVLAAVFYFLLPTYARNVSEGLGPDIHAMRSGSLLGALLLFLPPSLLLGCVSPMLVKLVFLGGERVGRTTGTLYAIGSCGNVMGILVADYVFLPLFTLNATVFGMGVVLLATGLTHLALPIRAHDSTVLPAGTVPAGAGAAA
jgi:nitrate/nitrite transporter NarK